MNNIVFGQYLFRNSVVHKMDSRSKLAILFILMIGVFLIPMNNFILLLVAGLIPIIAVAFSKISVFKRNKPEDKELYDAMYAVLSEKQKEAAYLNERIESYKEILGIKKKRRLFKNKTL